MHEMSTYMLVTYILFVGHFEHQLHVNFFHLLFVYYARRVWFLCRYEFILLSSYFAFFLQLALLQLEVAGIRIALGYKLGMHVGLETHFNLNKKPL
jgi:hypothetical protein